MDTKVIKFINNFIEKAEKEGLDPYKFSKVFNNGYCYYFAQMLCKAFNRGTVCIKAPYGHVVWVDTDGTLYDINGEDSLNGASLIPVDAPDSHAIDFKHVDTDVPGITREELDALTKKYHGFNPNS